MINLESVILRNVVHFKEARVDIRKNNGLVIISGHNKDSRIAKDQNNGAGKSLLWSSIPNLLFSAAPSSNAKNTKKDMLDKNSEIELRFWNNDEQRIRIVQKQAKWEIFEEDANNKLENILARTTTIQQEKIAQHFPLTPDEFYAYTFLSSIQSQRLHFQVEKPAERLKFITSIFQLDSYDRLKKYFTAALARIKDEQIKFSVIESKLLGVNTQLERVNWTDEDARELKQIEKRFSRIQKQRDVLTQEISYATRLCDSLVAYNRLSSRRAEISLPKKDLHELLESIKLGIKRARTYEKYLNDLENYEKNSSRIEKALTKLREKDVLSIDEIQTRAKVVKKKRTALKEALQEAQRIELERKRAQSAIDVIQQDAKELKIRLSDVDAEKDYSEAIFLCRSTLELENLCKHTDISACPTCFQEVDIDAIRKNVERAKSKLKNLERKQRAVELRKKWNELQREIDLLGETKGVDYYQKQLTDLEQEKEKLEEDFKVHEKIDDLMEDLTSIQKPIEPEKVRYSIESLEARYKKCNDALNIEKSIADLLEDNSDLSLALLDGNANNLYEGSKKTLEQKKDELKQLDVAYQKLIKDKSERDLRLGEYRILTQQKLELEKDAEEIQPLLKKRDIYKALEKAYSAKGLKVHKANEILGNIEANLNRYSNLIFAEPFRFSLYANERGVFCDVDRNNGKVSDVRLLSGSESDSFKLLFLLSLILLVPSHRRTNFLVLDEPDSHMDSRTRALFSERFIPYIRDVVPHVFLITPLDHNIYSDCEKWTVVKENGISVLQK